MGTKRPQCRRDWDTELREIGLRVGFEVLEWESYPSKRSKVLIKCAHGERWVWPQGQLNKEHCCRASSKQGGNNPRHGKPSWNSGTSGVSKGHGFGYKPRGELAQLIGSLYLVKLAEEDGSHHFKLGITKKNAIRRIGSKLIEVVEEWKLPFGQCFDLEQAALNYASQHGHRYSSPTTTELIRPEGVVPILEFIEQSLDDDGYMAQLGL